MEIKKTLLSNQTIENVSRDNNDNLCFRFQGIKLNVFELNLVNFIFIIWKLVNLLVENFKYTGKCVLNVLTMFLI
jgi:hypothetical protein